MASIFTKIISGEIPSYKVAESNDYFAFLDIKPLAMGHTLVVPKKEVDYIFDMSDGELSGLISFAKKVADILKSEVDCARIGLSVIGLEVPHTHIHLIPIQSVSDMNFSAERAVFTNEEYETLCNRLKISFQKKYGL
ncbi:MAG: HIT family protein [Saprospiraceae bacterium]